MLRHNFEINLNFLIKPFSYMTAKVGTKIKYFENEKRAFKMRSKTFFFIFFKDLPLKQIKLTFLEGEIPTLSKYLAFLYLSIFISLIDLGNIH